jgi:hypothetical protein
MTAIQPIPLPRDAFLAEALAGGATGFPAYAGAKRLADVLDLPEWLPGAPGQKLRMPTFNRPAHA